MASASKSHAEADGGAMQHEVDAVGVARVRVVDAQRAVARQSGELVAGELPSVAVDANGLPLEVALEAEATHIAAHPDFLARRELVTQPEADHGIDPVDAAGA